MGEDKEGEKKEEDKKDEEKKEEEKTEEKKEESEEEEDEPEEPEPPDEDPPIVELTVEEKNEKFRPLAIPDMSAFTFGTMFAKISLPSKTEGFTDIKYDWVDGNKSAEYLKKWVIHKKQTTRMEDIIPSPWFHTRTAQWQKSLKEWHSKAQMYRALAA